MTTQTIIQALKTNKIISYIESANKFSSKTLKVFIQKRRLENILKSRWSNLYTENFNLFFVNKGIVCRSFNCTISCGCIELNNPIIEIYGRGGNLTESEDWQLIEYK